MEIRPETAADHAAIRGILTAAFETEGEADLVEALRREADPVLGLVAEDGGEVLGHIFFSPVTLPGHPSHPSHPDLKILGLAPMAVAPGQQRQGIGSALVRAGLQGCRALGAAAVVVLGHPEYYPRFGFQPATAFDLASEYDAPEAFFALELEEGALADVSGTVQFHPAFEEV
jgi:putative acetyltransferase